MTGKVLTTGMLFGVIIAAAMFIEKMLSGQEFGLRSVVVSLISGLAGGFVFTLVNARASKK